MVGGCVDWWVGIVLSVYVVQYGFQCYGGDEEGIGIDVGELLFQMLVFWRIGWYVDGDVVMVDVLVGCGWCIVVCGKVQL